MLLSAGMSSDTLSEVNLTIIEGRRLAGNVRILAFGVSSGKRCSLYVYCSDQWLRLKATSRLPKLQQESLALHG